MHKKTLIFAAQGDRESNAMRELSRNRPLKIALIFVSIAVLALTPVWAGGGITPGPWRDINPTQYASAGDANVPGPDVPFNSIYVRAAGFGSVGAGEAWAVGGCGPTSSTPPVFPFSNTGCVVTGSTPPGGGTIAYYNGFSWILTGDPFSGQRSFYTGVNFCTSPGSPGVGLCSPNGDGTDGWIVGGNRTGPIAAYVVGRGVTPTPDTIGLPLGGYLTSVFETCHVDNDPNGKGCPSSLGAGDAYAAGTDGAHGVIYEYTGGAPSGLGGWHPMLITGAAATIYNSIYMFVDSSSGTLEGFAVGDNGVIARYMGGSWVAISWAPATTTFHGVAVDNNNPIEAWAVGYDSSSPGGLAWHFSSGSWSGFLSPSAVGKVVLESVDVLSTSEAWIVGTNSTILHGTGLPGSGFTSISTAGSNVLFSGTGAGIDLNSVNFQSSGNGWAVGTHGVILQTSDSSCGSIVQTSSPSACWGGQTSIVQTTQLRAVYENNPSDAWTGGLYDTTNNLTSLIHWDGQKWHRANVASGIGTVTKPDIYGIFMLGGSEGYAVGAQANATGAKCGKLYCPAAYTWNVITSNWWQAVAVAQCANKFGCNMTSVYFATIGPVDGWAVGSNGGMWIYSKSSPAWNLAATTLPSSFNVSLNSVFINNPGSNNPAGWAVGNNATILVLNCASSCVWSPYSITGLSTDVNLYGIYFSDSNHGWIVGSRNTIISTINNGGVWTIGSASGAPSTAVWRSVHIDTYGTSSGSGDGWAVGYNGTGTFSNSTGNALTAWFDGGSWQLWQIPGPVTSGLGLYSVFTTNPTDGWAVGAQPSTGVHTLTGIFHLDPAIPPVVGQQATTTNSSSSSSSTAATTSSSSASSSSSSESTTSEAITSSTTSTSAAESTVTVTSIPTTTSSSTTISVSTPMVLPAIPGFPWESIIVGVMVGMTALAIVRRRKK